MIKRSLVALMVTTLNVSPPALWSSTENVSDPTAVSNSIPITRQGITEMGMTRKRSMRACAVCNCDSLNTDACCVTKSR
mgnify:FL=1